MICHDQLSCQPHLGTVLSLSPPTNSDYLGDLNQVSTDHDSRGICHLSSSKSHLQGFPHHLFIHMPFPGGYLLHILHLLAKMLVASREVQARPGPRGPSPRSGPGQGMEDLETSAAGGCQPPEVVQHQNVLEKMAKMAKMDGS